MIISIDYDDTFTADTIFWTHFVDMCIEDGHTVLCITSRFSTFENRREIEKAIGKCVPVIFADHGFKEDAAKKAGYLVDIWIDDRPQCIRPLGENDL